MRLPWPIRLVVDKYSAFTQLFTMKKIISLLIFDDVEVLDFAGPFEVFSVANELHGFKFFDVQIASKSKAPVTAKNGLSINPDVSISEITTSDILIIPGGDGTRPVLNDPEVLQWVRDISHKASLTLSVCSGALILAKAGLLDAMKVTTHHQVFDTLSAIAPKAQIEREARYTDNGKIITSAGISAGIDMSLYVISRLLGEQVAEETAAYMEYTSRYSDNRCASE